MMNERSKLDIIAITMGIIASTFVAINFGWVIYDKAKTKREQKKLAKAESEYKISE